MSLVLAGKLYHRFHIVSNSFYPLARAIISLTLTTSCVVFFKFAKQKKLIIKMPAIAIYFSFYEMQPLE